ncbi:hypothetical protein MRS44_018809 [Fusarium solani]|uniref:uncharacterized protein n=1 Tax=Fusarium solani TaxID=169388 RepID=UPI0032C3FCBA|nr:hypothetical protein MRS44_018809 [Fusarium solani]
MLYRTSNRITEQVAHGLAGLCSTGGGRAIRAEGRGDADDDTEPPQELDEIPTIKETRDAVADPEYALDTQRSGDRAGAHPFG